MLQRTQALRAFVDFEYGLATRTVGDLSCSGKYNEWEFLCKAEKGER